MFKQTYVFIKLPMVSGKSLCCVSLPYVFDSLQQASGLAPV